MNLEKEIPIPKNIAVTGYSGGGGKTYFLNKVRHLVSDLSFSVSTTTRGLRGAEKPGEHYNFTDEDTFLKMLERGEFLEHNNPRKGIWYGSTVAEYERIRSAGKACAFDVDYRGIQQLKDKLGKELYVVLLLPSANTRLRWMTQRGDMSEEEKGQRLCYSETVERPFFQKNEDLFDKIIRNYDEETPKPVDFLANEVANAIQYHRQKNVMNSSQ